MWNDPLDNSTVKGLCPGTQTLLGVANGTPGFLLDLCLMKNYNLKCLTNKTFDALCIGRLIQLHIASALSRDEGVQMTKLLLYVFNTVCCLLQRGRLTPLHIACAIPGDEGVQMTKLLLYVFNTVLFVTERLTDSTTHCLCYTRR